MFGSKAILGLSITFFAGICFSLFSPAFNLATNDQWHTLKQGVPHLVVYTAFFYFSCSGFLCAIVLNIRFLYKPVLGLPKSSFTAYLKDCKGRQWAFLAGVLCGFGNGFQFMGGQAAGYAAADAVQVCSFSSAFYSCNVMHYIYIWIIFSECLSQMNQALPLVSTFWGILLFGEYRRSSKKTYVLLVSMLLMFVVAVAILMASSGHRKNSKNWKKSMDLQMGKL